MANVANFTLTTENKPSVFEIIAQKSLNDTLHPALQKVVLFFATNFPKSLHYTINYYDEIFLALNVFIQYYYLRKYDGTFSENFYGLKRVSLNNTNINDKQFLNSLLFATVLPYLKRKVDEKINLYRFESADGCLQQNHFEGKCKRILIFFQSAFEITWKLLIIVNFIKYMGNRTRIQLPSFYLLGIKLIYNEAQEDNKNFWSLLLKGNVSLNDISGGILRNGLIGAFEITAFFMQFLQMWNSQKANFNITNLPLSPAPQVIDQRARTYNGKCPLCLQTWKIPTVLPVSGYVFCFSCILHYLKDKQKCPITNLPAKPFEIVRLYDSNNVNE